jgi:hypothetical protein
MAPDRAVFTLSLDCEGLWGMANNRHVVHSGMIGDESLGAAYEFIIRTLNDNALKSTAAFVTCFAAEVDLLREQIPLIEQLAALRPEWFTWILPALCRGELDGWRGASFYRSMSFAGSEMAWHGATHLSLSEKTPDDAVKLEIELASRMFPALGGTPRTIVFPRNAVGHLRQLRCAGFTSYRARLSGGKCIRLTSLLNEWNIWDQGSADGPMMHEGWCISPAGFFLNWPSGARALIPISATVKRWKSMLRNAARHGGYVHMWFHPHNLITAPSMKIAFEEIARFAGQLIKSGDLVSLTIAEANQHYKRRTNSTSDNRRN